MGRRACCRPHCCFRHMQGERRRGQAEGGLQLEGGLGIEVDSSPRYASAVPSLILHEKVREVFERSLRFARETGYLKSRRMRVALDTTYILGRGAVKDTYNLLADGIVKLVVRCRRFWMSGRQPGDTRDMSAPVDACMDDKKARAALLSTPMGCWSCPGGRLDEDSTERQRIGSVRTLLLQDVERTEEGAGAEGGSEPGPYSVGPRPRDAPWAQKQQQAVRRTQGVGGSGHRLTVITAVDVLPGNASDNVGALELVERSEEGTVSAVEETIGDAASAMVVPSGIRRRTHTDSQAAPTPGQQALSQGGLRDRPGVVPAPRGIRTSKLLGTSDRQNGAHPPTESLLVRRGGLRSVSAKRAVCGIRQGQRLDGESSSAGGAASAGSCVAEKRRVFGLCQRRVVVEHRLARLVQLGVRQARYLGRTKTLFQLLMAATVANLTLVAGKVGKMGGIYAGITSGTADSLVQRGGAP